MLFNVFLAVSDVALWLLLFTSALKRRRTNGAANKNAAVNADPECFTKRQKRM